MSGRRVLFICNVDWFVLMHWRDLLADMVDRGHSVTVMCADTGRLAVMSGDRYREIRAEQLIAEFDTFVASGFHTLATPG